MTDVKVLCTKTPPEKTICSHYLWSSASRFSPCQLDCNSLGTSKRPSGVQSGGESVTGVGVVRRASCPHHVPALYGYHRITRPPPTLPCVGAVIWVTTLLSTPLTTSTSHRVLVQSVNGGYTGCPTIYPNHLSLICIDFEKFLEHPQLLYFAWVLVTKMGKNKVARKFWDTLYLEHKLQLSELSGEDAMVLFTIWHQLEMLLGNTFWFSEPQMAKCSGSKLELKGHKSAILSFQITMVKIELCLYTESWKLERYSNCILCFVDVKLCFPTVICKL